MKTKNIIILAVVIFLVFVGLIIGGVYISRKFLSAPLNPSLELKTPTPMVISPTATATQEMTEEPTLICNGSGVLKLIQIGVIPPIEEEHVGADAIRLVVVDFDTVHTSILAIPTDLWVPTPAGLEYELGSTAPLNLIYFEAYQATQGSDEEKSQQATQAVAQAIGDEFGFFPDNYMTINGDAFLDMVETLGGVDITLATAIDASAENYGFFPSGTQTLDAQQTLNFVRILFPNGEGPDEFGRFQRQNLVVNALLTAMISPQNWTKAPEMLTEVSGTLITDLSLTQIEQLTCILGETGNNTEQLSVSKEMVMYDGVNKMTPDTNAIRQLIADLED